MTVKEIVVIMEQLVGYLFMHFLSLSILVEKHCKHLLYEYNFSIWGKKNCNSTNISNQIFKNIL